MGWYYGKLSKKTCRFHPKTTGLEITFPASGPAGLLGGTDVMRIPCISLHKPLKGSSAGLLGVVHKGVFRTHNIHNCLEKMVRLKVKGDLCGDSQILPGWLQVVVYLSPWGPFVASLALKHQVKWHELLLMVLKSGIHQLRLVVYHSLSVYPITCMVLYIPGGCLGFLPSTVFTQFNHCNPLLWTLLSPATSRYN